MVCLPFQIKPMNMLWDSNVSLNYTETMIAGKKTQSKGRNRLITDISDFEPTKVKMEAGDLIIFNSCLPHCIRSNQSEKV